MTILIRGIDDRGNSRRETTGEPAKNAAEELFLGHWRYARLDAGNIQVGGLMLNAGLHRRLWWAEEDGLLIVGISLTRKRAELPSKCGCHPGHPCQWPACLTGAERSELIAHLARTLVS